MTKSRGSLGAAVSAAAKIMVRGDPPPDQLRREPRQVIAEAHRTRKDSAGNSLRSFAVKP